MQRKKMDSSNNIKQGRNTLKPITGASDDKENCNNATNSNHQKTVATTGTIPHVFKTNQINISNQQHTNDNNYQQIAPIHRGKSLSTLFKLGSSVIKEHQRKKEELETEIIRLQNKAQQQEDEISTLKSKAAAIVNVTNDLSPCNGIHPADTLYTVGFEAGSEQWAVSVCDCTKIGDTRGEVGSEHSDLLFLHVGSFDGTTDDSPHGFLDSLKDGDELATVFEDLLVLWEAPGPDNKIGSVSRDLLGASLCQELGFALSDEAANGEDVTPGVFAVDNDVVCAKYKSHVETNCASLFESDETNLENCERKVPPLDTLDDVLVSTLGQKLEFSSNVGVGKTDGAGPRLVDQATISINDKRPDEIKYNLFSNSNVENNP